MFYLTFNGIICYLIRMGVESNLIIIYDGYCKLCNFSLQFIMKRDKQHIFQYYPLQSKEAKKLTSENFQDINIPDSVLLIENGELFTKSEAFFKILPHLGSAYKFLLVFKILPKRLRNKVYDWIAKNRYKWFGQKSECGLPDTSK